MRARQKPLLGFWQIWNMCFGFLGIQFGFALQNANASRIFQTLGADIDTLPLLWVAAPLTGLVVQPIVGGGYEGTHFWVDPKREFVGVIMSQMWWIPEGGGRRNEAFRGELYRQFWAAESE